MGSAGLEKCIDMRCGALTCLLPEQCLYLGALQFYVYEPRGSTAPAPFIPSSSMDISL